MPKNLTTTFLPFLIRYSDFFAAFLAVLFFSSIAANAATMTVSVSQKGGALKKAGLGSLFGIVTNNVGNWKYYMTNSFLFVSEHQNHFGEGMAIPSGTAAVAPVIRGTRIKMMCRFGDLCYGWAPYTWPGLNNSWLGTGAARSWLVQVTNACNDIKANYSDVVYAIAIFNEPEFELMDTNFFNDPNIAGTSQSQRMNYVWSQTYKVIRSILPSVKIMGPNWEDYRPQYFSSHATMMRDFLTNAIATATVPDIIGWHNLNADPIAPGDVGAALNNYYRPLETSLNVPGRPLPVSIEEFGVNNGAFEGVPGQMVPYWAEFERDGIDFGNMGIYENGGDLGNTMRYTTWDNNPLPNAGWWMMNWYLQMAGEYIPVTKGGSDGVATWNSTNQTLTVLLGGADGDTTVQINGIGTLGLGSTVRVRLDMANWTTNKNVANTKISMGGDPQTGGYNLYDRNFPLDGSGNLAVPVNAVEGIYNGYRILITASNAPDIYPTKYEAENAALNHVTLRNGSDGKFQASNGAYIGGIDFTDSFLCFYVSAPAPGLYNMFVRYAAGLGAASDFITVNGQSQGTIDFAGTTGWANVEMRTTSKLVSLVAGNNDILFTRATNYAELDFIDVRPNPHRYEAELATNNNVNLGQFNSDGVKNCVGGINSTDSFVNFAVTVPTAGAYLLTVAYANGTAGAATHTLTVNGAGAGNVNYVATGGWLGGGWVSGANPVSVRRTSTATVSLNAGLNTIQLGKGDSYAELDYIAVNPSTGLTPAIPALSIASNSNTLLVNWPATATGYFLQQIGDLTKTNWLAVTNAVGIVGNQKQVAVPLTRTNGFFRLFP